MRIGIPPAALLSDSLFARDVSLMVLADTLGPIAEVVTFFKEVRDSHFSSLTVSVNRNQHIGQMGSVRPSEPRRSAGR